MPPPGDATEAHTDREPSLESGATRDVHLDHDPEDSALLRGRRVIVCVGCGGVGKTTMSAALALAAANAGLRTLCLTIDPARRLASALGLQDFSTDEAEVPAAWLAEHGVLLRQPLTVMMLDAKSTFDDLVRKHAGSPESVIPLSPTIVSYLRGKSSTSLLK